MFLGNRDLSGLNLSIVMKQTEGSRISVSNYQFANSEYGDEYGRDGKKDLQVVRGSSVDSGEQVDVVFVTDHKAERQLCRKFDIRILPVLTLMYLFNALDKGNLGNAKTDHMDTDLNFKDNQYNILLSVFYIPYVLSAPFFSILAKKYGPNHGMALMMFVFGSMTILNAAVHNWGGTMALRWFLGMAESAFFPTVIYYLTTFYRRGELGRRLSVFYAGFNIANAFSGLIAYGVFQINVKWNWRYLFIIEGGGAILFSIFAWFYLPASAAKAAFLTEEERDLAIHRIEMDSSSTVDEKMVLRDSLVIFKELSTYGFLAIEICVGVPLQSVGLFLPQIVAALGYGTVKTNLYTVAPNITGAVVLVILSFSSDLCRIRFPFIAVAFMPTVIGFVIFAAVPLTSSAAYFSCFMMTWGLAAPSVLLSTWYNNNLAQEGKRVMLTSIGVPLANVMGLVSSNIFLDKDKPKYLPALITTAGFGVCGAIITLLMGLYMVSDNKKRDHKEGKVMLAREIPTELLRQGPRSNNFRWWL